MPGIWRKVRFAVSFNRRLMSSPTECGICSQDVSVKFFCPICNVHFNCYIFDEHLAFLPPIISFGPSGQPSPKHLLARLMGNTIDEHSIIFYLVNTAEWLVQANEDLQRSYRSEESKLYIEDINEEREKLLHRYQLLVKVQEEHSAKKKEKQLLKANNNAENDERDAVITHATVEAVSLKDSAISSESGDALLCSICFDDLSLMRSARLDPCQHQFHSSCIMRWFESTRGAPCCCCRTEATKINGDDGVHIPHTFPFEKTIEQLLSGQITIIGEPSEIIQRNRLVINKLFMHLSQQKRLAIKHKRDERYSKDIEEELDLLRQRSLALDRYHLHIVEMKEHERAQASAAPDSAAGIIAATASDNALNQNEEADSAAASNDTDNAPLN